MRRILIVAATLAGLAATTIGASPATAETKLEARYSALYYAVKDKHGDRAPGRNIRRLGVRFKWVSEDGERRHWGSRDARPRELRTSVRQLRLLLRPPHGLLRAVAVPPALDPAGVQTASYRAKLPDCTWRPESGGSYTAANASGAYGKYQIMPEWYAPGRLCAGLSKSPGDQELCAARIYDESGAGNWVNC